MGIWKKALYSFTINTVNANSQLEYIKFSNLNLLNKLSELFVNEYTTNCQLWDNFYTS